MNVIGIDIGGTKCAVSQLTAQGAVNEVVRFETLGPQQTIERFFKEVSTFDLSEPPVFGISCGGPLDGPRGIILSPPNLPNWDGIEIASLFNKRFGGRAFLMNDANASALAEWRFGAGIGCQHMIFLTAGTGMGAGLILNGALYEGATGEAGEVGHMRLKSNGPVGFGKAGSFEGFCSGGGIANWVEMFVEDRGAPIPRWYTPNGMTAKKVGEAAALGDSVALDFMELCGERLGEALAVLIDTLNPERIVIGGIYPRCHRLLEKGMRRTLTAEALAGSLRACQILPSQLGEPIGSYAAVAAGLYGLTKPSCPPLPFPAGTFS